MIETPEAVLIARSMNKVPQGAKSWRLEPHVRLMASLAFDLTDCWYYRGSHTPLGYGVFKALNETVAHRSSWAIFNGPIPKGMHVLHKCDVRCCVNPDHLFLGTHTDNMRDMVAKGRHVFPNLRGEQHPNSKLNNENVARIKVLRQQGKTHRVIADEIGVSRATISLVLGGKAWVQQ